MVDVAGLLGRRVAADNAAMEAEPSAAAPTRKRRWLQFSLRTLLIGVTLLAAACGYFMCEYEIARGRNAMLRQIRLVDQAGVIR